MNSREAHRALRVFILPLVTAAWPGASCGGNPLQPDAAPLATSEAPLPPPAPAPPPSDSEAPQVLALVDEDTPSSMKPGPANAHPVAIEADPNMRRIRLDPSVLKNPNTLKVTLDLPDGALQLGKARSTTASGGTTVWTGAGNGTTATLATKGTLVLGTIRRPGGIVYEVGCGARDAQGRSRQVLRRIDLKTLPREAASKPAPSKPTQPSCVEPEPDKIRVAVHYTAKARKDIGCDDEDAVDLFIQAMLGEANYTFFLDRIPLELVLSEASLANYTEADIDSALNALATPAPALKPLHDHRNARGTDVVGLIASATGACGRSYQRRPETSNPEHAFFVVKTVCSAAKLSLVHEIAHIIGADHEGKTDFQTFPHGHGWCDPNRRTSSIMATECNTDCADRGVECPRSARWSNPDEDFGDPSKADNRKALKESIHTVSAYRCGRGS